MRAILLTGILLLYSGGCHNSPADRLTFPTTPVRQADDAKWYDVNRNGTSDFALRRDSSGKVDLLEYDDDEDGTADRAYRLSDYSNEAVPHLIILLDSIPFQSIVEHQRAGQFAWFDPPVKVIPPFPTMSEQIFSRILQCPPLPGMIDDGYDPRIGKHQRGVVGRVFGMHQPWEYRCHYTARYWESALSYVKPREWFHTELPRAKKAFDESPDPVTVVYLVSTSGMLGRYGKQGCDEVLDEVNRLCLQLLYERRGAIKISMCADHGHNMAKSTNVVFDEVLKEAGFNVTEKFNGDRDVVIDVDGLVTYLGIHTRKPVEVSDALLKKAEVELAMYLQQERVIVRDQQGAAAIEHRAGRYRYTALTSDVLGYADVLDRFKAAGKIDADGFVSDDDFFTATVDEEFPDAPHRLWEAFHGLCVNPPAVMLTIRDGFYSGHNSYRRFIEMLSTHGGLNQVNTATFLMTMTGRTNKPIRSGEIIPTVAPGYALPVRVK